MEKRCLKWVIHRSKWAMASNRSPNHHQASTSRARTSRAACTWARPCGFVWLLSCGYIEYWIHWDILIRRFWLFLWILELWICIYIIIYIYIYILHGHMIIEYIARLASARRSKSYDFPSDISLNMESALPVAGARMRWMWVLETRVSCSAMPAMRLPIHGQQSPWCFGLLNRLPPTIIAPRIACPWPIPSPPDWARSFWAIGGWRMDVAPIVPRRNLHSA